MATENHKMATRERKKRKTHRKKNSKKYMRYFSKSKELQKDEIQEWNTIEM